MAALKYIVLFLFTGIAYSQSSGTFELIAKSGGIGGLKSAVVGPGSAPDSERFYASYTYTKNTFDVLSIDAETGNTAIFHSPIPGEQSAESFAVGPNGSIFMGTTPNAHLVELDTKLGKLRDLGRPSATEQYIWDVTFGSDNKLYGVTYPNCKLVRYDPATGKSEDLGRLDPTQQYARFIAASKDSFIYAGIGSGKANIAAYEIRTGQHREILPPDVQSTGFAKVYRGEEGNIYGVVGKRVFRLNQWTATELEPTHTVPAAPENTLRDGRTLSLADNDGVLKLRVTTPKAQVKSEHELAYKGEDLPLFRICFGPDNALYGSTVLPIHLVRVDISGQRLEEIGSLGEGEVYSFLSHGQQLLMAAYVGLSTLMSYQPGLPFHPAATSGNPLLVFFKGNILTWRPMAMIDGPDGNVYIGAMPGYGQLGGALISWNTQDNSVQQNDEIIPDQSVVSLATWHDVIVGGTTVRGGPGSRPTQNEAKLFIWNPKTHQKEFDIAPVPGAPSITDLITASNGLLYGIAGDTLFGFDPAEHRIVNRQKLPFSNPIYNSVSVDDAGRIWGLAEDGIFMIDPRKEKVELIARSPYKITGGFGMRNGKIYFISGSAIYSYKM